MRRIGAADCGVGGDGGRGGGVFYKRVSGEFVVIQDGRFFGGGGCICEGGFVVGGAGGWKGGDGGGEGKGRRRRLVGYLCFGKGADLRGREVRGVTREGFGGEGGVEVDVGCVELVELGRCQCSLLRNWCSSLQSRSRCVGVGHSGLNIAANGLRDRGL